MARGVTACVAAALCLHHPAALGVHRMKRHRAP